MYPDAKLNLPLYTIHIRLTKLTSLFLEIAMGYLEAFEAEMTKSLDF